MQNKFNLIIISLIAIIFSACGKTENKVETVLEQDTSTVDTVCVETVSDTVETVIELHEFYDIFWEEFKTAAIAEDYMKIINEMIYFPMKFGERNTHSSAPKRLLLNFFSMNAEEWRAYMKKIREGDPDDPYVSAAKEFAWAFYWFLINAKRFDLINKENNYNYLYHKKDEKHEEEIKVKIIFHKRFKEEDDTPHFNQHVGINERNVYELFISRSNFDFVDEYNFDANYQRYFFAKRNGKYKLIAFIWYTP